MSILLAPARNVKTAVIFAPAFTRRLINPAFGRLPQRERRLPVGPSAADRAWAAANLNADTTQYEVVEPSFSDDVLDAMARESAELDRVCGQDFTRPAPAPAKARKPRRKVVTLHHKSKAAGKALASVETPLDCMTADQLIDAYAAIVAALPEQDGGWPLDEVREFHPAVAAKLDAINHALAECVVGMPA